MYLLLWRHLTRKLQSVMHYVELSERNGVSLDSLFIGVNALTMAHRKSKIYENMLLLILRKNNLG